MARVKLAARMVRAGVYGLIVGVFLTLAFTVAGGILNGLGFTQIPAKLYSAMGFLLGFAAPFAIEFSKEMEEG